MQAQLMPLLGKYEDRHLQLANTMDRLADPGMPVYRRRLMSASLERDLQVAERDMGALVAAYNVLSQAGIDPFAVREKEDLVRIVSRRAANLAPIGNDTVASAIAQTRTVRLGPYNATQMSGLYWLRKYLRMESEFLELAAIFSESQQRQIT